VHALSLNSKFLIERNLSPAFLTTQIDQLGPADFVLHRPWKAPKKGFKTGVDKTRIGPDHGSDQGKKFKIQNSRFKIQNFVEQITLE